MICKKCSELPRGEPLLSASRGCQKHRCPEVRDWFYAEAGLRAVRRNRTEMGGSHSCSGKFIAFILARIRGTSGESPPADPETQPSNPMPGAPFGDPVPAR